MTEGCRQRSDDLAAMALGGLDPADAVAVQAHVDGCPACAAALARFRAVVSALDRADPGRLVAAEPPPAGLDARVLAALDVERARERRRWIGLRGAAAAVVVAVAAAAVGGVLAAREEGSARTEVVTLADPGRSMAGLMVRARLTDRAWGTAVELVVEGSEPGQVYRVWLADEQGQRSPAGTFRGVRQRLEVHVAASLSMPDAEQIGVSTETDDPLLVAPLPAQPAPGLFSR